MGEFCMPTRIFMSYFYGMNEMNHSVWDGDLLAQSALHGAWALAWTGSLSVAVFKEHEGVLSAQVPA